MNWITRVVSTRGQLIVSSGFHAVKASGFAREARSFGYLLKSFNV